MGRKGLNIAWFIHGLVNLKVAGSDASIFCNPFLSRGEEPFLELSGAVFRCVIIREHHDFLDGTRLQMPRDHSGIH